MKSTVLDNRGISKQLSRRDKFYTFACLALQKFSAYTSLHGFIFIAKHDLPLAKRLFWIVVLINVFVMCAFHTWSLIRFWNEGNILMTKESASIKVWNIPFPAITVCGENQINKIRFDSAKKTLGNEEFRNLRNFTNMLCDTPTNDNYTGSDTIDDSILKYLFTKLTLSCEKTILRVFWMQDELLDPCQYIQPIILSTGLCYSLNMIPHENLFTEEYTKILHYVLGHGKKLSDSTFERSWRVAGDTMFNSVTVTLNLNCKNFEQYCEITGDGLKIFVHNPNEHPLQSSNLFITGGSSSLLLITPKSITTSDSLLNWNTVSRGCFYQTEKVLRYFKIYTQSNCELECRINKTTERCGCAPFYLPRSNRTLVCGLTKQKCVREAVSTKFSIFNDARSYTINGEDFRDRGCHCLPSCSELNYGTEVSQTAINWTNIALITLHFKKKSVDNWVRSPVIRFNELIANVGGIISLYIGCSMISFFEIICFVVMKKWLQNNSKDQSPKKRTTANMISVSMIPRNDNPFIGTRMIKTSKIGERAAR